MGKVTFMVGTSTRAPVGVVLRAPKTAELIATHLRRQIVRGDLPPGETLPPEQQLMEQFGVSRPTLREAFRILEAETLISVRRGSRGGAQVTEPDPSLAARYVGLLLQMQGTTIDDVYQARMISEPPCAALLATRRTQEDIADLTAVVEELSAEVAAHDTFTPDPDIWTQGTYRFHAIILDRCGNTTMATQAAVLQDIVATHLRARISMRQGETDTPERYQRVLRSYKKLIRLITDKDAAGAEKHWRSHMQAAGQYLLKDDLKKKRVVDLFD